MFFVYTLFSSLYRQTFVYFSDEVLAQTGFNLTHLPAGLMHISQSYYKNIASGLTRQIEHLSCYFRDN
jgi:hypothetical protein